MADEKIELKWYEKKQGITIQDKIDAAERKANKHAARKGLLKESDSQNAEKIKSRKAKNEKLKTKNTDGASEKSMGAGGTRFQFDILDKSPLFAPFLVPEDAREVIRKFDSVISSSHPLNSKQRALLPEQIRELSHSLTDERGERRLGYMNEKILLSAYTHYYLWWNLVRLSRLFSNLDKNFFNIKDNGICVDLGSGPLTVPIALMLSRPELRKKKLTWYCVDMSSATLSVGEDIYMSVCARLGCEPWTIVRVKGEVGTEIKDKADLVTSANVFNEMNDAKNVPPDYLAKVYTDKVLSYIDSKNSNAKIITIEPGDPKSARLISLMRESYMRKNFFPVAPCPHYGECAMNGKNAKKGGKWCNFAFTTEDAPQELKHLSERAELAKSRACLSFVVCEKRTILDDLWDNQEAEDLAKQKKKKMSFRVVSDPIRLPGKRTGYYACSERGLVLAVTDSKLFSGEKITINEPLKPLAKDTKSGATIINLK